MLKGERSSVVDYEGTFERECITHRRGETEIINKRECRISIKVNWVEMGI